MQRIGADLDVNEAITGLRDLLDDTARTRPVILTTALDAVLRLAPDSDLVTMLVDALLGLRIDFEGGASLWPEKVVERWQPKLQASVAHTARAINACGTRPVMHAGRPSWPEKEWIAESRT